MRTIRHLGGRSRRIAVSALGVLALIAAGAPIAATVHSSPGPRVADRGCVVGDAAGQVHCQDVLNNSLNNISVHILGH